MLRLQSDHVTSRGLVTVSGSVDLHVGEGSQPSDGLYRLVGRTILTETDRVVGGDVEDSEVGEGGESNGTGGVRDEVEEGGSEGDDTTVSGETVTDGGHSVLPDTEPDVSSGVVSEPGRGGLEVNGGLGSGQVGTGQIGRTSEQFGEDVPQLGEDGLGELSGSDGGVLGVVSGQSLFPSFGKTTLHPSLDLGSLLGVLLLVGSEQRVPLGLELGTLVSGLGVSLLDLVGNDKALVGVESPSLLELDNVVLLEG